MPTHRMHMTALEITHSRTPDEISVLVSQLRPAVQALTGYTLAHRSRLVRPMLSYDLAAVAISFVPAAGEPVTSPLLSSPPAPPLPPAQAQATDTDTTAAAGDDSYTYHHLRRDLFNLATAAGVPVTSRYVVPSAHVTLGRFLGQEDHAAPEMRERWTAAVDEANAWLEREVWSAAGGEFVGEWVVGQERGVDARCGTLWYGGGRTIMMGEGF